MRITESQLRKIVRQEILREAGMKGVTMVKGPDGSWVPSGGMSDWEGEGARAAAALRAPKILGTGARPPVEFTHQLEVYGVSGIADAMEMSVDEFLSEYVEPLADSMRGQIALSAAEVGAHYYSGEYDAFRAEGTQAGLRRFVSELESEIQGPAQSIEDGGGLDHEITEM